MNTSKSSRRWIGWLLLGCAWGVGVQAALAEDAAPALRRFHSKYGTYVLGKKPYPPGTREAWIAEGRALAKAPEGYVRRRKTLKGAADNRSILPPIRDQGNEGSCVHWAGTYYTKTANMKRRDPSLNVGSTANQCSPRFTYNLTNTGQDQGGWGHEPFEIFMRYGVPSWQQLPYVAGQYVALPDMADFIEGLHRRTADYVWVWEWNPTSTQINELKAFLDDGGVAVCGVYAENSFDNWEAGDAPWTGPTCTANDINHMVTVCGYGPGYYLVANSWGTSYGSNGFIQVAANYFENYFSDVMYPVEGTYEAATDYARLEIDHGRRSDVRSLTFAVNGTTVWNFSPLPKNLPKGTGSFDTDSRDDWVMAVDLTGAPWGAANSVVARCADQVLGTVGSISSFSVRHDGADTSSSGTPVSIPDNSSSGASATVSISGGSASLTIAPAGTNVPATASSGRQIAVTANVPWTATESLAWVTITGGSSGSGNGTVTYSVAANASTSPRSGAIAVSGGGIARTFTVEQAGASGDGGTLGDALDDPSLAWITGGDAGWAYQTATSHDGSDAAQSGAIGNNAEAWMQTTVTGPGELSFWWRVSSEANYDYLEFYVDGSRQSGRISGSTAWQRKTYSLSAGTHALRWRYAKDESLSRGSDCGWVDEVSWSPESATVREPYPSDTPWALPGTVEIENFDVGGQDVAYSDATAANEGGQYRPEEGVDIAADAGAGNGYVAGWTLAGEWLEYTVAVSASGIYALETSVGAVGAGGQFRILVDGADQTGLLAVPDTGAWDAYQTVSKTGVSLASGIHTVRVAMATAGSSGIVGFFDWFRASKIDLSGEAVVGDFDGDVMADVAIFQPAGGNWSILYSGGGSGTASFGWSATLPVPADYDGDGLVDVAVYHPAGGNWYVRQSSDGQTRVENFGWSATVPVPGDYDGDGQADLAVYHPAGGRWYFSCSTAGKYTVQWGWSSAIPVPADYDGDGKIDMGVYHPASGLWQILKSSTGGAIQKQWGWSTAIPVPADYDGDGLADIAVFHRTSGTWYVSYSGGGRLTKQFGWGATIPVPADYDGDGQTDLALYHQAGGKWFIRRSSDLVTAVNSFGGPGKISVLLYPLIHSWFGLP